MGRIFLRVSRLLWESTLKRFSRCAGLAGLSPSTTYYYSAGAPVRRDTVLRSFRTLPAVGGFPLKFGIIGDLVGLPEPLSTYASSVIWWASRTPLSSLASSVIWWSPRVPLTVPCLGDSSSMPLLQ